MQTIQPLLGRHPVPAPRAGGAHRAALVVVRLVGAALLGTMAGIHLHLWEGLYRYIHPIGSLFVLNGVLGALAALAVLATPRRWWPLAAAGAALLALGTLIALVLSINVGLFGFREYLGAPLAVQSIAVEAGAAALLGSAAAAELGWRRRQRR